jgi:hypothetical protein
MKYLFTILLLVGCNRQPNCIHTHAEVLDSNIYTLVLVCDICQDKKHTFECRIELPEGVYE